MWASLDETGRGGPSLAPLHAAESSMLQGQSAVLQALLGTFFTWGLTAAGAALVFVFSSGQVSCLAPVLRFGGGVGGVLASSEATRQGCRLPNATHWPHLQVVGDVCSSLSCLFLLVSRPGWESRGLQLFPSRCEGSRKGAQLVKLEPS